MPKLVNLFLRHILYTVFLRSFFCESEMSFAEKIWFYVKVWYEKGFRIVTGGHRKGMLRNDWWLRVIYDEPGLQNASPHYIILYSSVMQIINSHHFMMNYFPDLHFNDSRPSIKAYTLHVHSYAAHRQHTDVQMTALLRTTLGVCVQEKEGVRKERSVSFS